MEWIPIVGAAFALVGLIMMIVSLVMLSSARKRKARAAAPARQAPQRPAQRPAAAPPPPPPPMQPSGGQPVPPPYARPVVPEAGPPLPSVTLPQSPSAALPPPPPMPFAAPPPAPVAPPPPPPPMGTPAGHLPPDQVKTAPGGVEQTVQLDPSEMKDVKAMIVEKQAKQYGMLVGIQGALMGREIRLDDDGFVIGRDGNVAQLVITDTRVSKRHVWIGVRHGEVWAVDQGSTNGTYLNKPGENRITEVRLRDRDVLIISEDVARFEYRER